MDALDQALASLDLDSSWLDDMVDLLGDGDLSELAEDDLEDEEGF